METIKNYLDNMFAAFPHNEKVGKLKNDLCSSMEDKYNELKTSGKSENEAIGIVISEFGNIDELVSELDITAVQSVPAAESDHKIVIRLQDFLQINADYKRCTKYIALGVMLCILGGAVFLMIGSYLEEMTLQNRIRMNEDLLWVVSMIPLFLLVMIAVALFIYFGMKLEKYKYIEERRFRLDYGVEKQIQDIKNAHMPAYRTGIMISVILYIFSGIIFMLFASLSGSDFYAGMGFFITLSIVAASTYRIICVCNPMELYNRLLKEEEYAEHKKKENTLVAVVASIVWPITTVVYLVWSFTTNDWHVTWVIWPAVGILFGSFAAACNIISDSKNNC